MAQTNAEGNVPPKKPRIEVLMERNAKQTEGTKGAHAKILCRCQHRYLNKTWTEDRDCISKKRYINILATPRTYPEKPPDEAQEKPKKPIIYGPCPPRIEELARPNPTRVLNTWQMYYNVLSPERMDKLQSLLYDVSVMEPQKAIYHFRRLKAQNRRHNKKAAKKKKKKTPPPPSITQLTWMQREEMQTAKTIMEYFKNKPLTSVKYRHMCISDKLLDTMCEKHLLRKPRRKTKSSYEKNILEIADHVAVWFDQLVEDVEACEKREAELAGEEEVASSIEMGVAEEGEEEEEEESEEEEEWSIASAGVQVSLFEELLGAGGLLDEELLRKLIEILESGTPELLDAMIDPEALPGVTYGDVLRQLKDFEYTGEPIKSARGERLDAAMAEWATKNDSEKFDSKLRELVKFLAGILAHLLFLSKAGVFSEEGEEDELLTYASDEGGYPGYGGGFGAAKRTDGGGMLPDDEGGVYEDGGGGPGEGGVVEEPISYIEVTPLGAEQSGTGSITELEMVEGGDATEDLMEISSLEEGEAGAEGEKLLAQGYWEEAGQAEDAGFYGEEDEAKQAAAKAAMMRRLEAEEAEEAAAFGEGVTRKGKLTAAEEEALAGAVVARRPPGEVETEAKGLGFGMILGHKPSKTFEHTPDGICCISLKIYAMWLYEVAENAHNWSSWLIDVIQEVRNFTRIVKGEVRNPDGSTRVLKKDEWRKFVDKIEKMIVSWRQYSQHIGSLTERLMKAMMDKSVTCCPRCLSDNLIKDVTAANCLTEELTEGLNTAVYWRQWLDGMIEQTKRLITIPLFAEEDKKALLSRQKKVCTCGARPQKPTAKRAPSPFAPKRTLQVHKPPQDLSSSDEDEDVIYEIEEIDQSKPGPSRRP